MGRQLIFCMETNKNCKADYIYIRNAIYRFYQVDQANIKVSPVYMNGKGNYKDGHTLRNISNLEKQYEAGSRKNSSIVIYCFDLDDYDSVPEDRAFLDEAKRYCETNG